MLGDPMLGVGALTIVLIVFGPILCAIALREMGGRRRGDAAKGDCEDGDSQV